MRSTEQWRGNVLADATWLPEAGLASGTLGLPVAIGELGRGDRLCKLAL
jgi:hypothetical protein